MKRKFYFHYIMKFLQAFLTVILLLEKSQKKNEIPKPSFITFLGCFTIMENNGINSFYINYEIEGKKYPIYFSRYGIKWKINKIELPKKLFEKIK